MSISYDIKDWMGIKDPNISITGCATSSHNGEEVALAIGTLSRASNRCPLCHASYPIFQKNGGKFSMILLNRSNNRQSYLRLKKQRYKCKACNKYFTADSEIVQRNCFISRYVHFKVLEELTERQAVSNISKHCDVSPTTSQRVLISLKPYLRKNLSHLPECLLLDEFRSLKSANGKYSFSCMDGDTGKLFDILPSRRKRELVSYFMKFDREARASVKYIVTDMNAPYFALVKQCFPNARVVVDRFHVVQHLNRCFDSVRTRVMKRLDQSNPEQSRQYRQLKSLRKLLLKSEDKLNFTEFKKRVNFSWSYLTESDVVERLLSISNELREAYKFYQDLLYAYNQRDTEEFFNILRNPSESVPVDMRYVSKAFLKYEKGIRLAFEVKYSNAKLENLHTHIKVLKRVAYGFRKFENMKIRIFLLNGLIQFK